MCTKYHVNVFIVTLIIFTPSSNLTGGAQSIVNNTQLLVKKCCQPDEAYSAEIQSCIKVGNSDFQFASYDYFMDVLSMVEVDYSFDHLQYPTSYHISSNGKPDCNTNDSYEYTSFNIPLEPDEESQYDNFGGTDFIIEYPSYELFEVSQFKYHRDYCIDLAYKHGRYWAVMAMYCKKRLDVICRQKDCVRFCCPPAHVGLVEENQFAGNSSIAASHSCVPEHDDIRVVAPNFEDDSNLWEIYGVPECFKSDDIGYTTHVLEKKTTIQHENGKLKVGSGYFNYDESCIITTISKNRESNKSVFSMQINICKQTDVYQQGYLSWINLVDFQIIPAILIFATLLLGILVIYEWINNRVKLFSCLRICVIITYFIFNVVLCVVKLQLDVEIHLPSLCIAEAILIQYTYLATICWLNTMCFHVWSKFRKIRLDDDIRNQDLHLGTFKTGFSNTKFNNLCVSSKVKGLKS